MDLLERCTAEGLLVTVTPARTGEQLLRLSLPFPAGYLTEGMGLQVTAEGARSAAAVRVLTWHPSDGSAPRTARRALVTFPLRFGAGGAHRLVLRATEAQEFSATPFPTEVVWEDDTLAVHRHGEPWLHLRLLAPPHDASAPLTWETVEESPFYVWQRLTIADAVWPRRIEVRMDCLGTVVAVAHLQPCEVGDGWMPDLGWELEATAVEARLVGDGADAVGPQGVTHSFADGSPCRLEWQGAERWSVEHPAAPHKRRGGVEVSLHSGQLAYRYWRGRLADRIPMQERAWRRAEIIVAPEHLAPLTPTLQSSHVWQVDSVFWDHLYDTGSPPDVDGVLQQSLEYHHRAIDRSAAVGDDWGNVTAYSDDNPHGAVMGMNRLNHGVPIFEEGYRSGDARLLETAVAWCDNFHDLSIWWGEPGHGGTRYNNIRAMQRTPPDDDTHFMWRSNSAV
ncbi:MAG: hypothetical protein GX657_16815, partial [Chloroflexi bacterium]|nr:hypothetical protein [Chloroflexota bacterium]